MSDDGNRHGDSSTSGGDGDVAKRRSKNRVNARRSRERKRLMLDTLQQEHWQLHQKNQQIMCENTKLREAINTIKSLQRKKAASQSSAASNHTQTLHAPAPSAPAAQLQPTGNPLLDLLMQQLVRNQNNQANTVKQAPAPPPNPSPPQVDMLASLLLSKVLNNNQNGPQQQQQQQQQPPQQQQQPPQQQLQPPQQPQQPPQQQQQPPQQQQQHSLTPALAPQPPAPADGNALLAVGLGALIAAVTGNQNAGNQNQAQAQPNIGALLQLLGQQGAMARAPAPSANQPSANDNRPVFNNVGNNNSAQQPPLSQNFSGNNQQPSFKNGGGNGHQLPSFNAPVPVSVQSYSNNSSSNNSSNGSIISGQHNSYNTTNTAPPQQVSGFNNANTNTNTNNSNRQNVAPDLAALLQALSQNNRNNNAGAQQPFAFANNLSGQLSQLQHQAQLSVSGDGSNNRKPNLQ